MLKPGVTRAVLMAHGHRCQYCAKPATTADHIVPSHLGGSDDPANLTAACGSCNAFKGAKRLEAQHEKQLLARAWIFAGEVEDMAQRFKGASAYTLRNARPVTRALNKD